ncbi:copper amine oxidase N-terminal domain-containing protein [Paenibacillus sp. PL2-23]|uniref:copper amine oxidase N-terminal domain-containing protein n=1 Tax=Paenibacillus sp. PL2-23 TaxID=2100729 RepID=UPI0030F697C3
MKMKSWAMFGLLLMVLAASLPLQAAAATTTTATTVQVKTQAVKLVFDGQELSLPEGQHSFIHQGRTYVPIRYLSYALLKQVVWNGEKNEVTVSEPTEDELLELKKNLKLATGKAIAKEQQTLTMKVKAASLVFDGEAKKLPAGQSLFILQGSIYVPLRFLAESIGTDIGWDPLTRTVTGESAVYRAEQEKAKEEKTDEKKEADAGNGVVGGIPGAGGGGGGSVVKPTYEQITASAEASLQSLKAGCQSTLMSLAVSYLNADAAGKVTVKAQAEQELASCTVQFEAVLADTSAKLTANGYSTAVIAEYRSAFEAELAAGRALAGM